VANHSHRDTEFGRELSTNDVFESVFHQDRAKRLMQINGPINRIRFRSSSHASPCLSVSVRENCSRRCLPGRLGYFRTPLASRPISVSAQCGGESARYLLIARRPAVRSGLAPPCTALKKREGCRQMRARVQRAGVQRAGLRCASALRFHRRRLERVGLPGPLQLFRFLSLWGSTPAARVLLANPVRLVPVENSSGVVVFALLRFGVFRPKRVRIAQSLLPLLHQIGQTPDVPGMRWVIREVVHFMRISLEIEQQLVIDPGIHVKFPSTIIDSSLIVLEREEK